MPKIVRGRRTRLPTEVPGLDSVLGGGALRGGIYVVRGAPGSGKTILGNQICFANARRGGRSAYITLLAESHARMMIHLESLDFFDPDLVDGAVSYLSGYGALVNSGLRGVLDFVRAEVKPTPSARGKQKHGESGVVVVIDGFLAVTETLESVTELKKFLHELQLYSDLVGATVFSSPVRRPRRRDPSTRWSTVSSSSARRSMASVCTASSGCESCVASGTSMAATRSRSPVQG